VLSEYQLTTGVNGEYLWGRHFFCGNEDIGVGRYPGHPAQAGQHPASAGLGRQIISKGYKGNFVAFVIFCERKDCVNLKILNSLFY